MILDRFRMTDMVAVVTGAGRGIGAATAISLAEAGADVVISARTTEQLAVVAERIEGAGRRAVTVPPISAISKRWRRWSTGPGRHSDGWIWW